jgi:hypothetical protein
MSINKFLKKIFLYGVIPGLVLLVFTYGFACWDISAGVKSIYSEAQEVYPGTKVSALIKFVDSEDQDLQKRNRAIWALGQLGDPTALPVLLKYYTDSPCDHTKFLCQHELRKAIKLCKGGLNASAWTWR